MDINEVYEKITKKAWEDEAFRQKLLSDPKAAIKEAADIEIPASVKVTMHESKADDLYFVLPQNPDKVSAELSDSELDQVAGGVSGGKTSPDILTQPLICPDPILPPVEIPLIAPKPTGI